jgi:hypothetical protein
MQKSTLTKNQKAVPILKDKRTPSSGSSRSKSGDKTWNELLATPETPAILEFLSAGIDKEFDNDECEEGGWDNE